MPQEKLSDIERHTLLNLVIEAWARGGTKHEAVMLEGICRKLEGVDTVVFIEKNYR